MITVSSTAALTVFIISLGLWLTPVHLQQESAGAARSLRLPNSSYPLSYQLHITSNIHLGDLSFSGNVTIDIAIRQSTNEIVLHAKNLSDLQITLREHHTNELFDDLTHTYEPHGSFLIIHPRQNYQAFEAGQRYRLEIQYTALMQNRTNGLYWMTYEEATTNRTVYVAATQSEPTYARLLFPCYDEPAFKSNFSIKLTHSSSYTAISNMPVQQLQQHGIQGELTTTEFYATPPMSTYLVAFVISDFECISQTYRGVTQRIFTSPNKRNKGQQALKNAVATVAALEDYFGVGYPLEKLDHVALKKNYGAAMENWGLITYKEDNLILEPTADMRTRLLDTLTQNHEISHQWFGNLVSPEWWTYAWMNEGFATYFSYVITDVLYPEDKIMEFFIMDIAERSYSYNFVAVRPMTYYVERESDIMSVFDIISYQRAACVIKMFHHAFNQKTFVLGISRFLRKFQYTVANELLLFDSLQAALLEDERFRHQSWVTKVREIMLSWTHSEWIPIVMVTRNYDNDTITFSQRSKHSKNEHWWIPLNFASSQSPDFQQTHADFFMPPVQQHSLTLSELGLQLSGHDWLIVNKQQTGFYHVLYDTDNLRAIARQLQQNHTVIHPLNRATIFQDLITPIEHNEIDSVEVIFELLKYLEYEEDPTPWSLVADIIEFLRHNLFGTDSYAMYNHFVRRLITPTFRRMFQKQTTRINGTYSAQLAGPKILQMACEADLSECLDYTHALTYDYFMHNVSFQVDNQYYAMYDTVYCLGVRYLSDEEFHKVMEKLQNSERNSVYYDDMIYALRCIQDRWHLEEYLNLLLGENSTHLIMNDDESIMYMFYLYKSNMAARPVIWNFFERNYKLLIHSPNFVDHFNRVAEYMPPHYRPHFVELHHTIAKELQLLHPKAAEALIDIDSSRVGKKMRNSDQFLEKFEQRIRKWLVSELPPDVYAASLNARNGSNRPSGLLRAAKQLVSRALHMHH